MIEVIDIRSLHLLMEGLYKASGIPVAVFDLDGNMLAGAGNQELCQMFKFKKEHPAIVRLCPEGYSSCSFSAKTKVLQGREIVEQRCLHGVADIFMPIIIGERHQANLYLGKFLYEKPDESYLRGQAGRIGIDEEEYIRAIGKIPVLPRERIEKILEFHVHLIDLLVEMGIKTQEQRASEQRMREAMEDAEKARDRIQAILRSVADGLIVTGMNHKVILINPLAEQLLGLRSEEVMGLNLEEICQCDTLAKHLDNLSRGVAETAIANLGNCPRCISLGRAVQARISTIHTREGQRTGLILLLRDVTRERDLDRMKNEFISTAAHELRTPLTSILGFSELLLQKNDFSPELCEECLQHIHNNAEGLHEIVENLFILTRFQIGEKVPMDKAPCDLAENIHAMIESYQEKFPNHQFVLDLPNPVPQMVIDCVKVNQVLENLLSNAVKFSPEGGLVRVEGALEDNCLRISIIDKGIGMTEEQLERVFDKFYRADASDTAVPGLGLGMALAKNIIEAHGGDIQAISRKGEGTNITFTLPCKSSG
ncbi:MAG: PocR ligand-binding domain-containing protein [Syntrophotaleaceae bacterium]